MSLMDSMDDSNELVFRRESAPASASAPFYEGVGRDSASILNSPPDNQRGPGAQMVPNDSSARCKSFQFVPHHVVRHHSYAGQGSPGGYARLAQSSRPKFWLEVVTATGEALQRVPLKHKLIDAGVHLTSGAGGDLSMVRYPADDAVRVLLVSERPSRPATPFLELTLADLGLATPPTTDDAAAMVGEMLNAGAVEVVPESFEEASKGEAVEEEEEDGAFRLLTAATFSQEVNTNSRVMNIDLLSLIIAESALPRSLNSPAG